MFTDDRAPASTRPPSAAGSPTCVPDRSRPPSRPPARPASFLILHAFASGGAAMTGVEAISNGVPAFKPVEWKHARQTLVIMAVLLGTMFLGISWLAAKMQHRPQRHQDGHLPGRPGRVRQRRRRARPVPVHPGRHHADPGAGGQHELRRLPPAGQLPRQRRLHAQAARPSGATAWSSPTASSPWPSPAPSRSSSSRPTSTRLIPLYAIGVFTSFTLSQAGMAKKHIKDKEAGLADRPVRQRPRRLHHRPWSPSSSPCSSSPAAPGSS